MSTYMKEQVTGQKKDIAIGNSENDSSSEDDSEQFQTGIACSQTMINRCQQLEN